MNETLLIGIGAQKAGTTWLSDYLRQHQPRVHQTLMKEVHFFDNYLLPRHAQPYEMQRIQAFKRSIQGLGPQGFSDPRNMDLLITHLKRFRDIRSPESYLEFMRRGAGSSDILCDITPDYALLDTEGFKLMRALHPRVKLVFLLRNPADRFWSSLRFNQTHNPAFDIEANFDKMLEREDFAGFADYERTLASVFAHFSADDVFVEFYDALFTDAAIVRFTGWLGLPFAPGDYASRSNAAVRSAMPEIYRKRAVIAYEKTYRAIAARFNGELPPSWQRDIETYLRGRTYRVG